MERRWEKPACFNTQADWELWLDAYESRGHRQRTSEREPNYCSDCCRERQANMNMAGRCAYPDTEFKAMAYTWAGELEEEVRGVRRLRRAGNAKCKVDEDDVVLMRQLRKLGLSYKTIGGKFEVSADAVRSACNRRTWAHVP